MGQWKIVLAVEVARATELSLAGLGDTWGWVGCGLPLLLPGPARI